MAPDDKSLGALAKDLRGPELWPTEDDRQRRTDAVPAIVNQGSREALRTLIREWVRWIAVGAEPMLVVAASDAMRTQYVAVLPLIDQLGQGLKREDFELEDALGFRLAEEIGVPSSEIDDRQSLDRFLREHAPEMNAKWAARELIVRQRVARQLAEMSDSRYFPGQEDQGYLSIRDELGRYATRAIARLLNTEDDLDVRESLARVLGNMQSPEGSIKSQEPADILVQAVVGEDRRRTIRQGLLDNYYLQPSKRRGQEAAELLKGVATEAKRTLKLTQWLNVAVFGIGLAVLAGGLFMALWSDGAQTRVLAALAGLGGFGGVITYLIRNPLNRIQNGMANLVQMETAFTGFIWQLNLNDTYIQSQYVANGILTDEEIAKTVGRIEEARSSTMKLVETYTEAGSEALVSRITHLSPPMGPSGTLVAIQGRFLQGYGKKGVIAINHKPALNDVISWKIDEITFKVPAEIPGLPVETSGSRTQETTIWLSVIDGGEETNAVPFRLLGKPA